MQLIFVSVINELLKLEREICYGNGTQITLHIQNEAWLVYWKLRSGCCISYNSSVLYMQNTTVKNADVFASKVLVQNHSTLETELKVEVS
jgi:hypothetical protein